MNSLSYTQVAIVYLVVVNVFTFFVYGLDKWKAKRAKWRIREAALLGLAVLGGSIGALAGMKVWRHKTNHKKFKYGVPLIILAQLALILLLLCRPRQVGEASPALSATHNMTTEKCS